MYYDGSRKNCIKIHKTVFDWRQAEYEKNKKTIFSRKVVKMVKNGKKYFAK